MAVPTESVNANGITRNVFPDRAYVDYLRHSDDADEGHLTVTLPVTQRTPNNA